MNKDFEFTSYTKLLCSDKVKDRQEGLGSLKSTFATYNVDPKEDQGKFQKIINALFTAFGLEKQAWQKKSSTHTAPNTGPGATALRRLAEVASTIRWFVERVVCKINSENATELLSHLLKHIRVDGKLLGQACLDLVKALKCFLTWAPHIDNLSEEDWVQLIQLGFNCVLDYPPGTPLVAHATPDPSITEDSCASDEVEGEDEDSERTESRRKRRRAPSLVPSPKLAAKFSESLPVTLEKVEFISILATLLRASSWPMMSGEYAQIPTAILDRLERFLSHYPTDTSLHHDYLIALSAVLSRVALNHRERTTNFARITWLALAGMWGTKNQSLRGDLVIILRKLFPYLCSDARESDHSEGLRKLWKQFEDEPANRRQTNCLTMESLCLKCSPEMESLMRNPFVAQTFQSGPQFDSHQALAWASLELLADCAEKLYHLSESVHSLATQRGKRPKHDNPIDTWIATIRSSMNIDAKRTHFQALLFFIDRHWTVLHTALQHQIVQTLSQCLSFDDHLTQSWTFLCLSAIAWAEGAMTRSLASHTDSMQHLWDSIWTLAMRRSNVPAVCRAACHLAHILLSRGNDLLRPQRLLAEVETLAKDLDVQGPSAPYDSVCAFLVSCMRVASQDVSLYRMHVEDKVLTWLVDNWRPQSASRKLPLYSVQDTLKLVASICSVARQPELICEMLLPDCTILDALKEHRRTAVIRKYLLEAKLPAYKTVQIPMQPSHTLSSHALNTQDLVQPRARERRISSFFLKILEDYILDWNPQKPVGSLPMAEKVRSTLDFSVLALSFESLLLINGIQPNRRTIQAACKVITCILPLFEDSRWTSTELTLILHAFSPLYLDAIHAEDNEPWECLLRPGSLSGIRNEVLKSLTTSPTLRQGEAQESRRSLQRAVFHSSDVQDTSASLLHALHAVLSSWAERLVRGNTALKEAEDRSDGFAPSAQTMSTTSIQNIIHNCVSCLAVLPTLYPSSEGPTRDKQLWKLVDNREPQVVLALLPEVCLQFQQRSLYISPATLLTLVKTLKRLLKSYNHRCDNNLYALTIQFLRSTMHIWLEEAASNTEVTYAMHQFCYRIASCLANDVLAWHTRDLAAQFLEEYYTKDPSQASWQAHLDTEKFPDAQPPLALLPTLGDDEDIRVRFRASCINARLFYSTRACRFQPIELYSTIRESLCRDLDETERMLTRLLCLGNIIIISSAVRRGPYWHLLETCLHTNVYNSHIDAILRGVAARLGMADPPALFEIYASQIAYSVRQSSHSFMQIPPQLLGYRDRRECAERAFAAFTPMNILAASSDLHSIRQGYTLFKDHCDILQKKTIDGLRECLPELVGYQIVFEIGGQLLVKKTQFPPLDDILQTRLKELYVDGLMDQLLRQQADGIVTTIIRTLQDQDFTDDGPITQTLREYSQTSAEVFLELNAFRSLDWDLHDAILPAYGTAVVLQALNWFNQRVPHEDDTAITYHVMHRLFAALNKSLLVNEQLRILNALCLWVAYHYKHLEDPLILLTLLNGAGNIINQVDLALCAQSILQWGFGHLEHLPKDSRLTEILLRTGCAAYAYSNSTAPDIAATGSQILNWIEQAISKLLRSRHLRPYVKKAVLAWPREYPATLQGVMSEPTLRDLISILVDERILSNKFSLIRRMLQLSDAGLDEGEAFAKRDFWQLKQCIPAEGQLVDDESNAFVSLLVRQKGHINGLDIETPGRLTVCARYLLQSRKRSSASPMEQALIARKAIVASLLALLDDPSAIQVHLAFEALRSLATVTVGDPAGSSGWPSESKAELGILRAYTLPLQERPKTELKEVLAEKYSFALTRDHIRWITTLSTALSDILAQHDAFYIPVSSILQTNHQFAEQVLPVLVHMVLFLDRTREQAQQIGAREIMSQYITNLLSSGDASMTCRKVLVDTVLHLREWTPPKTKDPLAYDKWLDVDFLLLSHSAAACGAYTTALLFIELASEHAPEQIDVQRKEQVLYQIYGHIDEPDGFYAISTQDVHGLLIKQLHHEQQWDKAFQFHGAALETRGLDGYGVNGVVQSLRAFGFDSLAMSTLQVLSGADVAADASMTYHLGWRAGVWDLPEPQDGCSTASSLYLALRAMHRERDERIKDSVINRQLSQQMGQLRSLGHENLVEIREVARTLMCLNEVRQWRQTDVQRELHSANMTSNILPPFSDGKHAIEFTDLEAMSAARVSLLRSARDREQRNQIGSITSQYLHNLMKCETDCLLELSRAAREAGHSQIAINAVVRAQKLNGHDHFDVACEFANVLWETKEPKIATEYLKNILARPDEPARGWTAQRCNLLARMGNWASQASLEKPMDIKTKYFDAAVVSLHESHSELLATASVYHNYAVFAERQYHTIAKSPDVLRLKVYIDRKTTEVKRMEEDIANAARTNNMGRRGTLLSEKRKAEQLLLSDEALYAEHIKSRNLFLKQAIEMWSLCLANSDNLDDDGAIHLCSLWFANFDLCEEDLPSQVGKALGRVPSRKFVFLAHQLSARLAENEKVGDTTQDNLREVITRMCKEHPFHSLFPVFCIRTETSSGKVTRRSLGSQFTQSGRPRAAGTIFDQLRADPSCVKRIQDIERVCNASLKWAKYPIKHMAKPSNKSTYNVPSGQDILDLVNVQVPVMTAHTPIDPTCRYDDCIWISKYEPTFEVANGINVPKIIRCIGSDGNKYKQLFKGEGNDDLRQDAVMEQVFDLVNMVLRNDRQTVRRNLRVRGYKVIPLAAQAGVLEFVGNTTPLASWLHPAHPRYNLEDVHSTVLIKQMKTLRDSFGPDPRNVDSEAMTALFTKLMKQFHPVMRHWFTERTKDPMTWFKMRLYYARSVASTSIVGHILGLGDRHLSNILIDNDNGEVVHIDLGIAFEQGKTLPVWERVPFRLTADMVDGLGTTGTRGVFQRCAEETLRVLRDGSDVILTVLEVFKHDPLHSWTANAMKLQDVQKPQSVQLDEQRPSDITDEALKHYFGFDVSTSSGVEEAADRALNAVTRKLDKSHSVEFTVNELVAEATDLGNLANMYMGWIPHM